MKKLSIVYFGSPDFSAEFLKKLIDNQLVDVKLIVTQKDKPVGRKQLLTPTPVKEVAKKYKINFLEIDNLKTQNSLKISQIDIALVYAYSLIIPKELLNLPKYGFWCIHPSLLPKYRGSSPIATALINGDKKTGVTIIKMDEKIDHGPIIAQESLTIEKTDKRPDLEKKLTDLAFEIFKKIIIQLTEDLKNKKPVNPLNTLTLKPQQHRLSSYTKKLSKQDGFISFEKLKKILKPITNRQSQITNFYNLFRGLYPWPGIWTILPNGKRLKIADMKLYDFKDFTTLRLKKVQLEGKKEVDFETFNKSYKLL